MDKPALLWNKAIYSAWGCVCVRARVVVQKEIKLAHKLSILWFLVKSKSKMLQNTCPETFIFFPWGGWDRVHLVRRPLIGLLYQLRMIDEYGAFGGIRTGRGNLSIWRKPAPVSLCPLQILHDLTWDRNWLLTACPETLSFRDIRTRQMK
jgi:hypothetical protein